MSTTIDTANQEFCATSRKRNTSCTIQLLDSNYNILDELTSDCIDGSISLTNNIGNNNTFDYSSFSRISGSLTLNLTSDLATDYFKINLNSRARIIVEVTDVPANITSQYNLGIVVLNSPEIDRSADSSSGKQITITLNDLSGFMDGTFSGYLTNAYSISASSTSPVKLTTLIQAIAVDMGLSTDYINIEDNDLYIYSDITEDVGSTYADLLKTIMELYAGYELFFDRDGILTYRKIKDLSSDATIRDITSDDDTIISYKPKKNYENVKNYIIVWGATSNSSDTDTTTYQYNGYAYLGGNAHPFSVSNIGKRIKTISDETQPSNTYCISEAEYYLDLYTNYAESLEIEMIPDFRLIPNRVLSIIYEDEYIPSGTINGRYLINQVNFGLKKGDLATITLTKLYNTAISSDIITGSNSTS